MAVRILTGVEAERSSFVMPSDGDLAKLMRAVLTKYCILDGSKRDGWTQRDEEERERNFRNAFYALGYFTRLDCIEKKRIHAASFWASEVEEWLHLSNIWNNADVGVTVFTIALIAHGDIAHSALDEWPKNMVFGLQVGGGGHRGTDRWRGVLRGEFRAPEVLTRTRESDLYPQPNVRIVGDGY
jgi:hypothetical protein